MSGDEAENNELVVCVQGESFSMKEASLDSIRSLSNHGRE